MSIWGKIIGSASGFAFGGPIGALVGGIAGHAVDKIHPKDRLPKEKALKQIGFTIGVIVLINAAENKSFKLKELTRKKYSISIQGSDERGVNAMSISDITGIPRITVIRKLKKMIKRNLLQINEKKLITVNILGDEFVKVQALQDENMASLSNFVNRVFNQIKVIH